MPAECVMLFANPPQGIVDAHRHRDSRPLDMLGGAGIRGCTQGREFRNMKLRSWALD